MNRRQLQKLGVPPTLVNAAVDALGEAASQDLGFGLKGKRARELVRQVVVSPAAFLEDPIWGELAAAILGHDEESGGEF
jgi:tRNA-splicing ligase RtcB (3'-phosphate/5'-hydroxy nucleic acid ligase)